MDTIKEFRIGLCNKHSFLQCNVYPTTGSIKPQDDGSVLIFLRKYKWKYSPNEKQTSTSVEYLSCGKLPAACPMTCSVIWIYYCPSGINTATCKGDNADHPGTFYHKLRLVHSQCVTTFWNGPLLSAPTWDTKWLLHMVKEIGWYDTMTCHFTQFPLPKFPMPNRWHKSYDSLVINSCLPAGQKVQFQTGTVIFYLLPCPNQSLGPPNPYTTTLGG